MANKFKVGDKVKIVGNEESMSGKSQYFGREVIVEKVYDRQLYPYVLKDTHGWCWDDSELKSVYDNYKIVITTDGTITTAKLYENGKCTKTGEAKCNHKVDTFDFNEGAKLAFERLTSKYPVGTKVEVIADTCWHTYPIGSVLTIIGKYNSELYRVIEGDTYVTERDIKPYVEPEKPKYYNGKVVCISSDFSEDFTAGKVYEIKDGKFTDNEGRIRPVTSAHITCIEDLNNEYFANWDFKFIPFVED